MHIKNILNEDNKGLSPYQIYSDLNVRQLNLLYKLSQNEIDPFDDNLSEKTRETLDELLDLQLVDSAYGTTPLADRILKISYKVAPSDRKDASSKADAKRAMNRKEKPELSVNSVEDADIDDDDTLPEPEGEDEISLEKKPKKRKTNLRRMEPERDIDFGGADGYEWD